MSSGRKSSRGKPQRGSLSPEALELIAARFRALGEPMRLRLLSVLMHGERSVTELVESTSGGQANISKHLAVLRQANMVGFRKAGPATIYFIADPVVEELCGLMCAGLQKEMAEKMEQLKGAIR